MKTLKGFRQWIQHDATAFESTWNWISFAMMNRIIKSEFTLFLFAMLAVVGCSRQAKFSNQVASANHLLVTKNVKGQGSLRMSVDDEEVREVVSAVISGEICGDVAPPVGALKMEFFKGTNSLGSMEFCEGIFWTKDGEYSDQTGILRMLEKCPPDKWH